MIYLYAITDQPEMALPALTGWGEMNALDAGVFSLVYMDIAAVAERLTAPTPLPVEANLWQHEALLDALMADHTVLPVRFGTVLIDDAALQAVLAAHYTDFINDLKRVRGRVELSLRVLWNDKDQIKENVIEQTAAQEAKIEMSGRAYMLARLKVEQQKQGSRQQAERLVAELHSPLAHLSVQNTNQILPTPALLLKAAYLVEQDEIKAFLREVEKLRVIYPALRFLCTGPWPPYSFVSSSTART